MKVNFDDYDSDMKLKEFGITNKAPFKVPENYFDSLSARVMDRIQKENSNIVSIEATKTEEKKRKNRIIAWIASSAACVAIAFLGITAFYTSERASEQYTQTASVEYFSEDYAQEMMDYSSIDTQDIYAYLSGNDY